MENVSPDLEVAPKKTSVRRNMAWYLGGNMIYSASQFALVVILSRLAGPAVLGLYVAARALTQPPLSFASLNLRQFLAATRSTEFKFAEFLGLRIVALVAAMVFIIVAAGLKRDVEYLMIVILVALTGVFDMLSDVIYGIFQQNEQLNKISISRSMSGLLQISMFATAFYFSHSLLTSCSVLFLMAAAVTFGYDVPNLRTLYFAQKDNKLEGSATEIVLTPTYNAERLKKLFAMALPLALVWVFVSLHVNIPRYVVDSKLGKDELGFFGSMTTLMQAAALVWSALGHSTTPRLAKLFESNRAGFRSLSKKIAMLAAGSAVLNVAGGLLLGHFLLNLFFGPKYAAYSDVLTWLLAGHGMGYLVAAGRDSVTASQRWKLQPYTNGIGVIIILVVCNLLVPKIGMMGAAYAYLIGNSVMALIYFLELYFVAWRTPDLPTADPTPA
ncbi:MAG: hypothetical protein ACOYON_05525 [Fimbriimonas sp.]